LWVVPPSWRSSRLGSKARRPVTGGPCLSQADSGVGKTRLLAEFAAQAGSHGVRVLSGDCVGEGELPYAPLVAVSRSLVRVRDPVLSGFPSTSELATLLPESGDGAREAPRPADASAQGRMFEALLWLLDRLRDAAPVVLAIEDLHWADRATARSLRSLAATWGARAVAADP
jgi:predicted ATPase